MFIVILPEVTAALRIVLPLNLAAKKNMFSAWAKHYSNQPWLGISTQLRPFRVAPAWQGEWPNLERCIQVKPITNPL
jgi:hypothetical protein